MALVLEFGVFLVFSLAIMGLSVLAQNSISVVLIGCAAAYGWLWWPKNKIRLVTSSDQLQIFQLGVGVFLGAWGAYLWTGTSPHWFQGGICETLAFFFFISGFPQDPSGVTIGLKNSKVKTRKSKLKSKKKPKTVWGLGSSLLVALVVLGAAMEFMFYKRSVVWALVLMASVVGVTVWLKCLRKEPSQETVKFREDYILWGLVGWAALMRFPFIGLNLTGLQIDEANDLQGGQDIFFHRVLSPFATGWSGRATFPFAIYADAYRIFGMHVWVIRALSVICALLMVWVFYKLSRYFFGIIPSVLGTLMLSFSWWCLWGSYIVIPMMMQDMGVMVSFYFLEIALREGKRIYFWWSGVIAAITLMTYVWGRTAPLLLLLWLIVSFLFTENASDYRKNRLWGILAWLGGFFWLMGPFIGWWTTNQEFFGRIKELSMMGLVEQSHDWMLPVKTFCYTLLSPFITYSVDERFSLMGRPLFDRVSSLLLVVGIVLAFMALRKRSSWLLLLGLASCIPANALAIQNDTPDPTYLNGLRFFCVLPFVYWGVVYGLDGIWNWIQKEGKQIQKVMKIFLAVVLAGAMLWNAKWFYLDFHQTGNWSRLGFNHLLTAKVVQEYAKTDEIYLCAELCGSSVVQFLDPGITLHPVNNSDHLPLTPKPTRNVMFILRAWGPEEPFKDELMRKCPHAVLKDFKDPTGVTYLWGVEVPLSDLLKAS